MIAENSYQNVYETEADLFKGVNTYFHYYNTQGAQQILDYKQPEKIYKINEMNKEKGGTFASK